jgi:hypothetical protein
MSLSKREERVLAAIEADVSPTDPVPAHALTDPRERTMRRLTAAWAMTVTVVIVFAIATANTKLVAIGPLLVLTLPVGISRYGHHPGLARAQPPHPWPPVH